MNKEEKTKHIKKIVIFNLFSILLIFLVFRFGFSAAVKISEIFQNSKAPQGQTSTSQYVSPPVIYQLISATSSPEINVSGLSTPNNKVEIYLNDLLIKDVDVDLEGKFSTVIFLDEGNNKITAATKNSQGNLSPFSEEMSVYFSNKEPSFEIIEPADNTLVRKNEYTFLKGKTDKINKIYINDHLAVLDNDGIFNYQVKLNPGENNFKIICYDPALNKSEKDFKIRFQK